MPTSPDCAPGGLCAGLNKTGQCSDNGFCVTGDLRVELDRASGEYTADSEGKVLFGWADDPVEEMPVYEDPTGPIGLHVGVGPLLVAFVCTMGVGTPDEGLISFPIETP